MICYNIINIGLFFVKFMGCYAKRPLSLNGEYDIFLTEKSK